ncbi:MAG TPA: NAD(+) diphosphatase [Burkholderiales bacterium]|nr:NAD(+) diphosphatase [Burkholderiales bacterium]
MSLPFERPAGYAPAIQPPAEAPERSLWFIFRGAELLVTAPPSVELPRCRHPNILGIMPRRTQYLGVLGELHCFTAEIAAGDAAPEGWVWQGLRALFAALDDAQFALAGRALQLVDWDRSHQYCGACGAATAPRTSERSRECPACGLVAYPRLAPAVMALVRRGRELLLARSPRFAKGVYSALAGFVEPGETLEQCLEREVHEEVGIRVRDVRYFASQPWPFPHSLMIAFFADYDSGEILIDGAEIEDARWFDIENFENLPRLPARISIARKLIDAAIGEMRVT